MTLVDPFWLVLAIPLAMALWRWRLPSRLLQGMRLLGSVLLLLALCGLSVRLPSRSGTVVLVMDRSLSMPPGSAALQQETADLVHAGMRSGDELGVVSFAETAAVEQAPQAGKFTGFAAEVGGEASHLADAIDLGLSLIGRDDPGRLLVLSDGRWTGRDIGSAAARAAAAGVAVDYRLIERHQANDLAIERVGGPESVRRGESFMITAWLDAPRGQTVSYELLRGSQVISRGTRRVTSGLNRLVFRDTAAEQGVSSYQLRVEGEGDDPVPENNRARLLVGVRGARPVLCVNASGASGLPPLLAEGGLDIQTATPSQCDWTLEGLAGYAAVVLENTPASAIGHVGMENLAAWVSQSGGGLMFTGGKNSYGPGGYFKSPLDPIMPVSMELRREHRKLSLAVVVALDRSGSMAMTVPGGRAKMDLANLATAEVVDMLGPLDQFGCLAVDSTPHEIVALRDVTDRNAIRREVLRIDSRGGGIFVHEALVAATRMIASATAGTRHIILFADAADSERPGNYKKLIEDCVQAGITISVVGLGSETDRDAPLLKDIARRAGGQCMFTNIAQELPRLFAQDMFLLARSAFLEDPVAVRPTGGLMTITRQPFDDFPHIGGYNLCYRRPNANLALVSVDQYQAPVLATWQAGLGRVLCYAGEADGEYTGAISSWDQTGGFFASLARWTAGKAQGLGDGVVATQELRNGVCRIELHLDPARQTPPFSRLPELSLLAARPGETAATGKAPMRWSSADTLVGEIPLSGSETLLATISAPELGQTTLPPVCLPYSPEYLPSKPGRGDAALEQLASSSGGRARLNLADIWSAIPWNPRLTPLSSYLLLAAAGIFLLEIIQRRTRVLSVRWLRTSVPWPIQAARRRAASTFQRRTRRRVEPRPGKPDSPPPEPPASAGPETPAAGDRREEAGDDSMLDALSHARQRAQNRTGRH